MCCLLYVVCSLPFVVVLLCVVACCLLLVAFFVVGLLYRTVCRWLFGVSSCLLFVARRLFLVGRLLFVRRLMSANCCAVLV